MVFIRLESLLIFIRNVMSVVIVFVNKVLLIGIEVLGWMVEKKGGSKLLCVIVIRILGWL